MPAQVKFTMKKSSAVTIPMSGANGIKKSVCFTGYIDVGDELCWWQLLDVDDGFGSLCHQQTLSFNIGVGHQQPKDVTNIEIMSLTSKNCHQESWSKIKSTASTCHQHPLVTKIYVAVYRLFSMKKSQNLATKYKWDSEHCSNTKTNYGNAWCRGTIVQI